MTKNKLAIKNKNKNKNKPTTRIASNAASGFIVRNKQPNIQTKGSALMIHHVEPLTNVVGGAAGVFVAGIVSLVPIAFPWLNGVAINFSKYRWHRLTLFYVPTIPTSSPGEMAMGLSYDRQDTTPTSMQQVQTYKDSVSSPVWGGADGSSLFNGDKREGSVVYLDVDVKYFNEQYWRYVTNATFGAMNLADQNVYCAANLIHGNFGASGATTQGRIYAKYSVELIEPIASALNN